MKSAKGESIRNAYVMFAAVMAAMSAAVSAQGAPDRIGPLNAPAGGGVTRERLDRFDPGLKEIGCLSTCEAKDLK